MAINQNDVLNDLKKRGFISDEEYNRHTNLIPPYNPVQRSRENNVQKISLYDYFKVCLQKYAVFQGRARRKEFWAFRLYCTLFLFIAGLILGAFFGAESQMTVVLSNLITLALFLPDLAVTVRRLHDVNMSGWWILTIIVPFIISFVPGDKSTNKYGEPPFLD